MRRFSGAAVQTLFVVASLLAASVPAATIANDDSCDIAMLPAATLLLPYFEVDFRSPVTLARMTLFTVQNTTAQPQIARVTLWTDWAYPMYTFNLFLTGYDVQPVNLYDLFARGAIAPTSNAAPPGSRSAGNGQNPHFLADANSTCATSPGPLGASLLAELQTAFTKGIVSAPGCAIVNNVGGVHANAVGYATIDVVANCNAHSPLAADYFTHEILFDNVLTGDYQHVNPNPATGNYAGGNPLVHIRAVPEGGTAGAFLETALPYTFYDLYTTGSPLRTQDRRQPLPSAFMPRFIEGGTGAFNTNLMIWREAFAGPTFCPLAYAKNSFVQAAETIRFDEHENPTFIDGSSCAGPPSCPTVSSFAATSSIPTAFTAYFPPRSQSGDVGGWLYLNLNNGGSPAYGSTRVPRPSQAWVVTSMAADGRFQVEMNALAVGNGCSPAPALSKFAPIGPAP
jgi:hypothetical protein